MVCVCNVYVTFLRESKVCVLFFTCQISDIPENIKYVFRKCVYNTDACSVHVIMYITRIRSFYDRAMV